MSAICYLGETESAVGLPALCNGFVHDQSLVGDEKIRIIEMRCGEKLQRRRICDAHLKKFFYSYASHQKFCSNPFSTHTKNGRRSHWLGTAEISLRLCNRSKRAGIFLIPGKKLCIKCKINLYNHLKKL